MSGFARSMVLGCALALVHAEARGAGVVGTGVPSSCTEAAFDSALAGGGTISFNCGGGATVIPITTTKALSSSTTIDGTGEVIILDGGGATQLFKTTYQLSAGLSLVFRRLTLRNSRASQFGAALQMVWQDPARLTVVQIEDVSFENNVVTAAGADVGGGAIHAVTGVITVRRSVFRGNRGGNGGAIGHIQAQITIEDSTFEANQTHAAVGDPFSGGQGGHGGAIYTDGTSLGALTLRRVVFSGNSAGNLGGAIHSWMYGLPSSLVVEGCTFFGNTGVTNGGAIFHMNGRLTISGSTFVANTVVGQGGALWEGEADAGHTPVAITNSTFQGNRATGRSPNTGSSGLGGAIRDNGNPTTITHVTIAGNHADWVGGGIVGGQHATLRASILANNTAANGGNSWNIGTACSSPLAEGGFNLQWPPDNSAPCTSQTSLIDPRLGPIVPGGAAPSVMLPLPGSPAIDRVTSTCPPPSSDQRGMARPRGSFCDAGAAEYGAAGDATGEGRGDILLRAGTGEVHVLASSGSAFQGLATIWSAGFVPYRYDVYYADVGGDGFADLVSRSRDTGAVEAFRSTGSAFAYLAGTGPGGLWSYGWGTSYDLYFADVTGDGKADLVGRLRSTGDVYVFPSTGTGFASAAPGGRWSYGWSSGYDLYFEDVTGDGRSDLVSRYYGPTPGLTGDVYVAVSSGTGFSSPKRWTYGYSAGYDLYLGDANGDGRADLVSRYYGPNAALTGDVYVMVSTGTSFAWVAGGGRWTYGWGSSYELLFRDYTGDGRVDLAGRHLGTGEAYVAASDGSTFKFLGTWASGVGASYQQR